MHTHFRRFKMLALRTMAGDALKEGVNDATSRVENQNDLELYFKVFFFIDSCCLGIVLDESN